ncbi:MULTISPECIES: hypothetical protein [Achromobacter]|uniref:Uncharacterized protein n=1 Tax=Achromobacter mucicolens TaxID=1389922 RepID=A0ABM8LKI1_9BURK|nr:MULTISPECIES: hypothetical protein [Achromobacter]CAB3845344.1 hypothetical protein LMG3410_01483 [Achromobacter aegrifaciens]CAB3914677.1 hypothetical protein LMG3415_05166 [Achromobacter mucicolens]
MTIIQTKIVVGEIGEPKTTAGAELQGHSDFIARIRIFEEPQEFLVSTGTRLAING